MDSIRSRRAKTISTRLGTVTEDDKKDAVQARIEALENDGNMAEDPQPAGSDDEFQLESSDEGRPCFTDASGSPDSAPDDDESSHKRHKRHSVPKDV